MRTSGEGTGGPFTPGELAYLDRQRLGRLATAQPGGQLQNTPVSCYYNPRLGTIDIGGHNMAASRKFRNVHHHRHVALVVDDVVSYRPPNVRCLEIRGHAEAIDDPTDSAARTPGAIIRIHPVRVISWGIDAPETARGARDIEGVSRRSADGGGGSD